MIPLPLLNGDTLLLDNSTMERFQGCPRAAQYAICERLQTAGVNPALKFGGIAHKCLELRYTSAAPMYEQTPEIERLMVTCATQEFHGIRDPNDPEKWIKEPYIPPQDEFRNYDRMVELIREYGIHYQFEAFDIIKTPDGRPFVEFPFVLGLGEIDVDATFLIQPLYKMPDGSIVRHGQPYQKHIVTLPIVWMGKIDIVYSSLGGLYIMDHKTASMATNMAEFEISHQFKGYEWAVERILGVRVSGTVINRMVIRKPTVKGKGEPFTFERKLIMTQRGILSAWKDNMLHIIADFVEMVRRGFMPMHTLHCTNKFGTCQFHPVCTLDSEDQRQIMLGSQAYQDVTWSPLVES